MKRGSLILLLFLICVATAGCTFYYGGWATSSGLVLKMAAAGGAATPLPSVQITYTSVSDPDFVWQGETDSTGHWMTPWLKIDKYTVEFDHPDCETRTVTVDVRDKGADTPVGPIHMWPKGSSARGK